MPEYLIAISVGPIQSFIAAARATHDLWFGSYVLSEVSKAVALSLHQQKVELIFPHPKNDLQPNSELNVANKLLALVSKESPEEVKQVLEKAKEAARARWKDEAQKVFNKFSKHIRQDIWDLQINDVLELYGAWVKLGNSENAYKKARERLEKLLSARKCTRDFEPSAKSFDEKPYFGLPKSSLDAARETVLQNISNNVRRRLRLSEGEQLDCPGVVKRLGGEAEQFPSVVRIALETWLQQVPEAALKELEPHYDVLVREGWATRVTPKRSCYKKLLFDGSILFPDRIEALQRKMEEEKDNTCSDALKEIKKVRRSLYKKYDEPTPYYAILVADGDKMGKFLDEQDDCSTHQQISRVLDEFAREAKKIVEKTTYRGACVYTGGDDVMALLPVNTALACADELRKTFAEKFTENFSTINQSDLPTLSVGLGIVHAMNPFSHSLGVARRAEKFAKNGKEGTAEEYPRNALAIIVDVRSGAEIEVRGRWNSGIVERLHQWQECYNEQELSSKTPYDLLEAVQEMEWARDRKDIVQKEINRVLKKKRANAGTQELSEEVIESINDAIQNQDIFLILNELRVARWLTQQKGA